MTGTTDINALAAKMGTKVDTTVLTFLGFSRSPIGREMELIGPIFTYKAGQNQGPLTGNYGAYYLTVDEVIEAPAKEDFTLEKTQHSQMFSQRVTTSLYKAIEKTAKIVDNRIKFY